MNQDVADILESILAAQALTNKADVDVALFSGNTASGAGTAAQTPVTGFKAFSRLSIAATITGITGGTLDVYIQRSPDGVKYYDLIHFPTAAAGDAAVTYVVDLDSCNDYVVIGTDLTPALEAGGVAGLWSDRLRVLVVTGTGASAGAALVVHALGTKVTA